MKKALKALGLIIVILLIVLVVKTSLLTSKQIETKPDVFLDIPENAIQNLIGAIQIPSISYDQPAQTDTAIFSIFHKYLQDKFPLVFQNCLVEKFNGHALLFKWQGLNDNLKPIVLLAHQDVVPVIEENWEKAPFAGINDGEFIWGRGTLDDKGSLIAIMESVQLHMNNDFKPDRTIYLAFGNDEEILGNGAKTMASVLHDRGIEAEFVLDEGMVITSEMVPMVTAPVALIGTSEKGYLTVELSCEVEGGHSASPQPETAISILSNAIVRITDNQLKPKFAEPVKDFLEYLGPEIPWPARIVFANRWLFGGIIKSIYSGTSAGNALVRTTTAPTVLKAGEKENVLPAKASLVLNHRLLPGDDIDKMLQYLTNLVDDDRVKMVARNNSYNASPVSPSDTDAFMSIHKTIKQQFPGTIVAPTLMTASSDSKNYKDISSNIYRFAPYHIYPEDMARIHGDNERISIENYKNMIGFYYRLIENTCAN